MTNRLTDPNDEYRLAVRRTMQAFSDQALAFQDSRISRNDCIDRQELDRELARRQSPEYRAERERADRTARLNALHTGTYKGGE